jgi:hypothetical protein
MRGVQYWLPAMEHRGVIVAWFRSVIAEMLLTRFLDF